MTYKQQLHRTKFHTISTIDTSDSKNFKNASQDNIKNIILKLSLNMDLLFQISNSSIKNVYLILIHLTRKINKKEITHIIFTQEQFQRFLFEKTKPKNSTDIIFSTSREILEPLECNFRAIIQNALRHTPIACSSNYVVVPREILSCGTDRPSP